MIHPHQLKVVKWQLEEMGGGLVAARLQDLQLRGGGGDVCLVLVLMLVVNVLVHCLVVEVLLGIPRLEGRENLPHHVRLGQS